MIPRSTRVVQRDNWQQQLQQAFTSLPQLLDYLQLPAALASAEAAEIFAMRVPVAFAARMQKGNPRDPLLLQVLPRDHEIIATPGFTADPLHERNQNPLPGLLHKYHGRALIVVNGVCAINCRYCFRRHFPYQEQALDTTHRQQILAYIANDPTISEIILSGGDPLLISDKSLQLLLDQLMTLPQIKRLRIHTRIPIVLPDRITAEFLAILQRRPWQTILVVHANHAQEIDATVTAAISKLHGVCHAILNQAVLLREVNDSVTALCDLSTTIFAAGIMPYYLHLLDKVAGAAHFEVSETAAQQLLREISAKLPGYLVPKLVREVANTSAKQIISY